MSEKAQPGSAYERLQRRYLDSLPGKRAEIEEQWTQLQAGDWAEGSVAALKRPVHRLAGSAGSYGLEDLGRAAAALDRQLGSTARDTNLRESVAAHVGLLLQAFDRAPRPD